MRWLPTAGSPSAAKTRDAGLSVTAALAAAIYLFPYKAAGNFAEPRVLSYSLLLVAAILNTLSLGVQHRQKLRAIVPRNRLGWWVAAGLSILTITGNFSSAHAVALLSPAVTSLLLRMELVFVGILGAVFLGESPRGALIIGASTALVGLVVMRSPLTFDASMTGALWALAAALSFAAMQVTTRRVIKDIAPVAINAVRLWMAVLLFSLDPGLLQAVGTVPLEFWGFITLAAIFGPFVGRLLIMYSLRSLSAARSALVLLLSPVFAFLLSYAFDGVPPSSNELIGGALMLVGIALPSAADVAKKGWRHRTDDTPGV
jgi:drug/metabolite transporter (DMT)-like permease